MELNQTNVDAVVAELAQDSTKLAAATQDPRSYVLEYFTLTDAERQAVENLAGHHWQNIAEHIQAAGLDKGGSFHFDLGPAHPVPPDAAKRLSVGCQHSKKTLPDGTIVEEWSCGINKD